MSQRSVQFNESSALTPEPAQYGDSDPPTLQGDRGVVERPSVRVDALDVAVASVILAFGLLQIIFVSRAPGFLRDDVFYLDAARSLIQHHFYGIAGRAETNMPPGLSGILAGMCVLGACTHTTILRAMAVMQALGFIASYALLRRLAPRAVAAGICLLLCSSPEYFRIATQLVQSYFPYFLVTTCALLVVQHLETTDKDSVMPMWGAVLAILCVLSLMMASAGIALVGALFIRVAFNDRRLRSIRGRVFLAAALVGVAAQALWGHRQPPPLDWPLPGYPRPYLDQLLVKSGNYPELGMATARDVIARVATNTADYAGLLSSLIVHHWVASSWASAAVAPVVLFIVVGWLASVRSGGGRVHDWYFAGYALIYLLWPWTLESRFFLPVAPLACLYLWRGGQAIAVLVRRRPRLLAASASAACVLLAICAWSWMQQPEAGGMSHHGVQAKLSFTVWLVSVPLLLLTAWKRRWMSIMLGIRGPLTAPRPGEEALRWPWVFGGALVLISVLLGMSSERDVARDNLDVRSSINALGPDDEAGIWLESHAGPNAVVMARHVPTVSHFSGRRVVWFPPSSDPRLLMDGIQRLKVDYLIVAHRVDNYYLPSDDDCFKPLVNAYPNAFRSVFQNADVRIYETHQ